MRISDWSSDVCSSDLDCDGNPQSLQADPAPEDRGYIRGGSRGASRSQRDFGESSQLTDNPGILLTIAAFIAVIGPLVFVHELGHYLMARLFGVKAETFSIGVGKELAAWVDKRGTRWRLAAQIGRASCRERVCKYV